MSQPNDRGIAWHQRLSFSPLLCRMEKAPALFWPGCALMTLDPAMVKKTYHLLQRQEPELGISSACCGQPSRFVFPEKLDRRRARLTKKLQQHQVQRIYTACPNCERELAQFCDIPVKSIWPLLMAVIHTSDVIDRSGETLAIHDPCPQRHRADIQEITRELMRLTGANLYEPPRSREKTLCCGNKGMQNVLNPERADVICRERLKDFPPDLPICACCQGCLGSFAAQGHPTLHLLEVLFGACEKKGWGNRIRFSRSF